MQQKLLSLAIAGALAIPGAAMADVTSDGGITIYGKIHASYDVVDTGAVDDDTDDNTAAFRNSRLGFKGSEDLGNGLKGIWQVETKLDTEADDIDLRNTFVGLEGDSWGKVFFGKHDTPYKMATAKLDVFSDTIADYNNIIGAHMTQAANVDRTISAETEWMGLTEDGTTPGAIWGDVDGDGISETGEYFSFDAAVSTESTEASMTTNFDEREPQIVAYMTPNFNGFQAAVARESYQMDEGDGNDEVEGWSAMAMYDQGPFFASLGYELYSGDGIKGATADSDIDAWKVGLGYSFGDSRIGFVYEDIDHDADNSMMSRDAFWGSFAHKFGANEVKLAYGKADESDADNDDGADTWAIGLDHNFSKRTKVYAIYTHMDNDANANYGLYTDSNNAESLTSGYYTSDTAGNDLDAFSVGIIHKF